MHRIANAIVLGLTLLSGPAFAHEYKLGDISIHHPWARATPPGAEVGGAYVVILNAGATADRLVSVTTPLAEAGEIHEMTMVEDVMKMRRLENGLEIPAGGSVELKPGGIHIMLVKLKAPLVENVPVMMTLMFERAGPIEVELVVEKIGATESIEH
jgi:copper(I)-binding protein